MKEKENKKVIPTPEPAKPALQKELEKKAQTVVNIDEGTVKTTAPQKASAKPKGKVRKYADGDLVFTKQVMSPKGSIMEYAVPITAGDFTKLTGVSTRYSAPQGGYAFLSLDEQSVRWDVNPSGRLEDI